MTSPRFVRAYQAATAAAVAWVGAASPAGPPPVLDDFDDDAIGPLWTTFASDPDILDVQEANGRLEFSVNGVGVGTDECPDGPVIAQSGLVADGWAIDFSQDFRIRIDFNAAVPFLVRPPGSAELSLDLVYQSTGEAFERGLRFIFGGPIFLPCQIFQPAVYMLIEPPGVIDTLGPDSAGGTLFLWYDAAADDLRWSFRQFDDPKVSGLLGLGESSGVSRFEVMLRGTVQLAAGLLHDTYSGDDLHLDDFVVAEGGIVDTTCLEDVDGSGSVGIADFLAVLGAWGTGASDLDVAPAPQGDATVDLLDFLAVLAEWGPCR